ncbi:hypothetical protein RJ40_10300 [Methanofollis aquaemaris]|uniref:DUF115 domain-containing protein n=1 Tax=Methanofollis aquaemaris TaxID=126734 RepID=A0A8A3S842_9EURY|nr:hypothetical protein [Methanofollis aquaemaris]QSZ67860.1 hypothetical protein RJ40_10300 [Methanofollis aquaemaris]
MDQNIHGKYLQKAIAVLRIFSPYVIYYKLLDAVLDRSRFANVMTLEQIRDGIKKDTIFIFGSGFSINSITPAEFETISNIGDTLSFNYFFKGMFVPIKYHICGEVASTGHYGPIMFDRDRQQRIDAYYSELLKNRFYSDTIFLLRYKRDYTISPIAAWSFFSSKYFVDRKVCLYGIKRSVELNKNGSSISHNGGTLSDAVNIAYILGYKKIVLVGVDLYDRRYFWLNESETRDIDRKRSANFFDVHDTAKPIIKLMGTWRETLEEEGVALYVYNPKSLLREVLPLYSV